MKKFMPISKEELNKLPTEIAQKVLKTLKSYDETVVTYSNGKYHEDTSIALLGNYPKDYKFIGTAYAEDIYTIEERAYNYIATFGDRYTRLARHLTAEQIIQALEQYIQNKQKALEY